MIPLRKILFITSVCFFYFSAFSQVNENFSDGNFTSSPIWTGNTPSWVVNNSLQLQSNNTTANNTFYLSTASSLAVMAQWEFFVRLNFNTSSANYADVFLISTADDLSANTTSGFFVRIGNTQDEISLYRKDGSIFTRIIDGPDGVTNQNDNLLRIRVIRGIGNQFTLYVDATGSGNSYTSYGSIIDNAYTTSSHFGFLARQSTSSFFQKHYFDDILIQPYAPDITPPSIQSVTALSPKTVDVLFSEPVEAITSQNTSNYIVNNNVGNPMSAVRDAVNSALVHLTFATNFPNGVTTTITINNIKDAAGNAANGQTGTFSFYTPQRFDVVIDEIMADPSPVVSLPNAEFVELKNVSGRTLNLGGWRIATTSGLSNALPAYNLPADSFLIITSATQANNFMQYGNVIGVANFPSLDNNGTLVSLVSNDGTTIHAINYNISWYQNALKIEGGWTLEMIDTKNPCTGTENWRASIDNKGGTPSKKNSIDGNNPDQQSPVLLRTYTIDHTTIIAEFNEPLDSISATPASYYFLDNGIGNPFSAQPVGPLFNQVRLNFSEQLSNQIVYELTVSNVTDCSGNSIGGLNKAGAGLPSEADSLDMIVNEILFNPKPAGVDYVEIYNRTNKVFDASGLFIATRNSTNEISSIKKLSEAPYLIFPGEFITLTENRTVLQQEYHVKNPQWIINVSSPPSFPDDKGSVILLNQQGKIVDELNYNENWHFALINNEEGVSLERIDYNKLTNSRDNWTSAASAAGHGTPTYQNSQLKADEQLQGEITITPKIFSPDNDGIDDICFINYQMSEPNFVASVTVFDANGRLVRKLYNNATLAQKGFLRWDGLDDKGGKLPIGIYIIYAEVFNLQGKIRKFKSTVTLARRL